MKNDENGWWEAPRGINWLCSKCNQISPIENWKEVEPDCEDCGSHDGRECPNCKEWFDHVWGATEIKSGDKNE